MALPAPHKTLWQLANGCLDHAKQLAPFLVTHGESALNEYRRDIIAAIALFRAVLVNSTDHKTTANGPVKQQQQLASIQTIPSLCNSPLDSGLSIGVEAKTRYMLARVLLEHTDNDNEAITQARKVIHLTQRTLGMKSIRMGAYEIQIQIQIRMGQFRVARASLKDAQNEAERLKLHGWYYHFIMQQLKLLRSDMLARNKPTFTAQLAILLDTIEYARENKHEDVQVNDTR
ncbi:hypothetical protein BDF19DRAFT_150157 [Syncephalis fuscata]|nr:hypothetical protein BDF19DRAFT_150157 [Syncephalis fuscata]